MRAAIGTCHDSPLMKQKKMIYLSLNTGRTIPGVVLTVDVT